MDRKKCIQICKNLLQRANISKSGQDVFKWIRLSKKEKKKTPITRQFL